MTNFWYFALICNVEIVGGCNKWTNDCDEYSTKLLNDTGILTVDGAIAEYHNSSGHSFINILNEGVIMHIEVQS